MPCAVVHATVTLPDAGWGKRKVYGPAPEPTTDVAGMPLIRRLAAFTPVTGSVNTTMILVRAGIVDPELGVRDLTSGAEASMQLYAQVEPGAEPSKARGGV